MLIELTRSQCDNLRDYLEFGLLDEIRRDEEIDNMRWLYDMVTAWYKLDQLLETTKAEDDSNAN